MREVTAPREAHHPSSGAARHVAPGPRLVPASVAALATAVRDAPPRLGPVRLVCVDGPAGSGKSTLAGRLADATGGVVVHLDDLYEGWSGLGRVWDRVEEQLLAPLAAGRAARYQRYDWDRAAFAEWRDVPVPAVLVLEGCGSAPAAADGRASLVVWVEAPADVRLARGIARDGEALRAEWLRWMDLEEQHFVRERTRERADVHVDGTAPYAP
ncbi:uridine kinase family protein [Actinotalea solisilvae]|uniref:uridine kinase family protein n=1 Tax=Actinotalea solisilvae TaxID=2072922 RepID=UPI0027DC19E5|nr:uridine kinase [Actinotalea solisilvae]